MNFGPLEFAAYLRRLGDAKTRSSSSEGRDAAVPGPGNTLTIVSGPVRLPDIARSAQVEAVSVFEALAAGTERPAGPVRVLVRPTLRPVVLVLSSHRTVEWQISPSPGANLAAVLLAGYGESTVAGAGTAMIASIGGFYAFKRGSSEYRHLESEVLRCTGRTIENFQSIYAGDGFEIG